jgi:hypothetical protein
METSVPGLNEFQNPRKTRLFPDSCTEPKKEQQAVYQNRQRVRGDYGKRLLK